MYLKSSATVLFYINLLSQTSYAFVPSTFCGASIAVQSSSSACEASSNTALFSQRRQQYASGDFGKNRKEFLSSMLTGLVVAGFSQPSYADSEKRPDQFDIDDFLRTGQEMNPMGVSSQAGTSRPETGVFLRDGTEISRNGKSGDVLAEIVLRNKSSLAAALVGFTSPWPIAKGSVYDVECRDANTGDGVFLAVSGKSDGKSVETLPSSFFLDSLFSSVGRFSFYGSPTDIKVKKSYMQGDNRIIEVTFSNLSQSTQTEIPRNAVISANIPSGADEAVMLVGSATANRWRNKGAESVVRKAVDSFSVTISPKSSLKVRAKTRGYVESFD